MAAKFFGVHPMCRPPRGTDKHRLRAFRLGKWLVDDGKPALAFIEEVGDNDARVYTALCSCLTFNGCPLGVAMEHASDRYDATTIDRRPIVARRKVKK